ncbi:hypothetical protein PHMEG_00021748 [Phytophthora megakarya]|uniref:Ankyrin repeat-containing domain n=1 Tax=Phytophthora megakarya TaxID=4795 RepID=A0A225VKV2_9STRA|nr:hypothetical protein PHMEG_00021748 [Phytophthora megakarya]
MISKRAGRCEPWKIDLQNALEEAAPEGHLEVVKLFHEHTSANILVDTLNTAASTCSGHLAVVKYEICESMARAAEGGYLEIIKWLDYHSTSYGAFHPCTIDKTAVNGHLVVIKWICKKSKGYTVAVMNGVAENGYLTVVEWLHENRHEGCIWIVLGQLEMIEWLFQMYKSVFTMKDMMNAAAEAARERHVLVLQFFGTNTCFLDPEYLPPILVNAFKNPKLPVVEWLVGHGYVVKTMIQELFTNTKYAGKAQVVLQLWG